MRIIDFNLGRHSKTGEPHWRTFEEKNGITTMVTPDRRSKLQPREGLTRFLVSEPDKAIYESPSGKFRILAVNCVTALPQIRSQDEYIEKEDEPVSANPYSPPINAGTKKRHQKTRKYVDLPPDGKKAKLSGRPRDRKLGKGDKNRKKGRAA